MMLSDTSPELTDLRTLIPPRFHAQVWIAGSAATSWPRHGDVDAWVCELTGEDYETLADTLDPGGVLRGRIPWRHADVQYAAFSQLVYDQMGLHILATQSDITTILGAFDISCHAGAFHLTSREMVLAPFYDARVRLGPLASKSSLKTLIRLMAFSHRYKQEDAWHDDETQRLVLRCLGLPNLTPGLIRLMEQLSVGEGL